MPELDDGELDYIQDEGNMHGGEGTTLQNPIPISSDPHEDGDDYSTEHNLPRARRTRAVGFEEDRENQKPANSRRNSDRKPRQSIDNTRGARRTSKANTNSDKRGNANKKESKNKTLTQMGVQRLISIESDDDDDKNLDYIPASPREDGDKKEQESLSDDKVEGDLSQDIIPQQDYFKPKRRKLSDGLARSPIADAKAPGKMKKEDYIERKSCLNPATPRKTRRFEVPSSQSPESPGFADISPSLYRTNSPRPPLKEIDTNVPRRSLPGEGSPTSRLQKKHALTADTVSTVGEDPVLASSMLLNSPGLGQYAVDENAGPNASHTTQKLSTQLEPVRSGKRAGKGHETGSKVDERSIVYETDAESDYDETETESPSSSGLLQVQRMMEGKRQAPEEDYKSSPINNIRQSPEAIPTGTDVESKQFDSEAPLSSNASIFFARQQQPTQYPIGPIPDIDTQMKANLFPHENEPTQLPPTKPEQPPTPPARNRYQMSSQLESQIQDEGSTEIVPESSPVAQGDDDEDEPVVQVESSQPADRIHRQAGVNRESGPRGVLSRSRLLPPSLMDSIPVPVIWTGSQDSVGEPYSLPDG